MDITAEVGLLTRNVKVQSEDYPDLYEEKYGGRLIVGQSEFSKGMKLKSSIQRSEGYIAFTLSVCLSVCWVILNTMA